MGFIQQCSRNKEEGYCRMGRALFMGLGPLNLLTDVCLEEKAEQVNKTGGPLTCSLSREVSVNRFHQYNLYRNGFLKKKRIVEGTYGRGDKSGCRKSMHFWRVKDGESHLCKMEMEC